MIRLDEGALICDLAETYHVLNYRELSPKLVATLASGLSIDSRIKKKTIDRRLGTSEFLLAGILDRLSLLVWFSTEDGRNGVNKPRSVLAILEDIQVNNYEYQPFNSIEEYETKRAELFGV